MTNEQIVFQAEQELAKEGRILYTGRVLKMLNSAGETIDVPETEQIHTYRVWQEQGYQVQKGQKAVVKLMIWKHTGKKVEDIPMQDGTTAQVLDKGHMFMKLSAFFSRSQVEKIQGAQV